jgi:hypothetical protein
MSLSAPLPALPPGALPASSLFPTAPKQPDQRASPPRSSMRTQGARLAKLRFNGEERISRRLFLLLDFWESLAFGSRGSLESCPGRRCGQSWTRYSITLSAASFLRHGKRPVWLRGFTWWQDSNRGSPARVHRGRAV